MRLIVREFLLGDLLRLVWSWCEKNALIWLALKVAHSVHSKLVSLEKLFLDHLENSKFGFLSTANSAKFKLVPQCLGQMKGREWI